MGWSTDEVRSRVRRREWVRLLVGVLLVDPSLAVSWSGWSGLPLQTRISAAAQYHGPECVLVGHTAARLHGLSALPLDDGIVHLRLPPGRERHQQPGVRVHTLRLAESETTRVDGVRVTTIERTVTDLVLSSPRQEAVALLDSVLAHQLLTREQVIAMQLDARGRRGIRRTSAWWDLADGRAASPLETRIRLVAIDAGLPPDELQIPVRDRSGVLLGYGDMAWHTAGWSRADRRG